MSVRPGIALAEMVITLSLGAIIGCALGAVLLTQLRTVRIVAARVAAADAMRTVFQVVPAELRAANPAVDIGGAAGDSIAARLPRLVGTVCGRAEGRTWFRGSGMREPDAGKDSVLLIGPGTERVFAPAGLVEDPGACAVPPGSRVYRIDLPAHDPGATLLLIFERGSYYLRDRALRFRIGGEGRQPLTEEVFRDAESSLVAFVTTARPGVRVTLAPRTVFGRAVGAPASVTMAFLNQAGVQ